MALIACNECGSEISDRAASCPKCGAPVSPVEPANEPRTERHSGCLIIGGLIASVVFFMVIGAVNNNQGSDGVTSRWSAIEAGKDELRRQAKDPDSVKFEDVWAGKMAQEGTEGVVVACGYFNAKNGFGAYTGLSKFVASSSMAVTEETGGAIIDELWRTACIQNRL